VRTGRLVERVSNAKERQLLQRHSHRSSLPGGEKSTKQERLKVSGEKKAKFLTHRKKKINAKIGKMKDAKHSPRATVCLYYSPEGGVLGGG